MVRSAIVRARRRGPNLNFDVELTPLYLEGEPDTLERAVTNLLDNALASMGAGLPSGMMAARSACAVCSISTPSSPSGFRSRRSTRDSIPCARATTRAA